VLRTPLPPTMAVLAPISILVTWWGTRWAR
jgi:hypothetical protein